MAMRKTAAFNILTAKGPSSAADAGSRRAAATRLRLLKVGQCTSAAREWLALHRLVDGGGPSGRSIEPELLHRLLSALPAPAIASRPSSSLGGKGGVGVGGGEGEWQWGRREKFKRLVKAVCEGERLDADQQRVLRETSDMVFHDRIGFSLVQGPPGTGKTTLLRALLNTQPRGPAAPVVIGGSV